MFSPWNLLARHALSEEKWAMVQKGVWYRCAKHPAGRSGNGTRPLFEPLPKNGPVPE